MTVEVLISTMHQGDYSLLDKINLQSDAVVVNQCDKNGEYLFKHNGFNVRWINSTERGLSRSRNTALRYASGDICLIADDDMIYRDGYVNTVLQAFSKGDAEIIGFKINGIEREFKKYPPSESKVSYMRSMKMASVELAFTRNAFVKNKILFDEAIGAGTEFLMGEENALLFECLRKGLRIKYQPHIIADLHIGTSSWFACRDEKYFVGKGASFAAMKTPFTSLLILQFALRKRRLYANEATFKFAFSNMLKGKKLYKERTLK